ncbi:tRNA glutamyl-Q(34) synthetase GluQRS [Aerophototrophica crusticola]|uniref:tRNA glutamyl-Q(34) synthetase GluQRS n=1 Tax=Aerophototrophica crusticola TaxID=1709002 RepID=A0A858R375_9PROT|nr:tRNA glutamyl-Q(34) synthetase GluQRS [Rhodospirillaceae bacterium B3]
MTTTRFAPSPTGYLHLGHAHSALFGWRAARDRGGRFLLRVEDIDPNRCRPEFEAALKEDLAWLGLDWDGPVRRQSDHMGDYAAALAKLAALGVTYPCFCSRKEIQEEIARAGNAPHLVAAGPEGPLYPGTCRHLDKGVAAERVAAGVPHAIRLDVSRACALTGPLTWDDLGKGRIAATPEILGDVVLARRDVPTSYHLAVTVDDHLQGVTLVTRGEDLFHATHVHRLLQALLGYAVPEWWHHGLLLNAEGQRLSKRDGATALRALRDMGRSPAEVRALAGFPGAPSGPIGSAG